MCDPEAVSVRPRKLDTGYSAEPAPCAGFVLEGSGKVEFSFEEFGVLGRQ